MQPQSESDYKKLLTEVIQKQMVILGPSITLAKARNVKGLSVADDGTVTNMDGKPQELIQALINQFVQLSGLIVTKTMEPLLAVKPDIISQNFSADAHASPPVQEKSEPENTQGEQNK
jgi:NADH dehydrogenase/NADH:ubiquinone oxidoreductase subunit G